VEPREPEEDQPTERAQTGDPAAADREPEAEPLEPAQAEPADPGTRLGRGFPPHLQRNLITGVLTLIPLWVTWIALNFIFGVFADVGRPLVMGVARAFQTFAPGIADVLRHPWFEPFLALVITLIGLYLLGWATTKVLGMRLLRTFEEMLDRIPLVKVIYGSVKKVVTALQMQPEGVQRVVLIDFPTPGMKAVGFVTSTVPDAETGRELAMVYVPTTPNPTSGYMEVVPVDRLTPTDWTLEEATRFIITGGTSSPDHVVFGEDRPDDHLRDQIDRR
jgi:uncharacterized membrane protein